jgi:hypothetical protein
LVVHGLPRSEGGPAPVRKRSTAKRKSSRRQ